MKLNLWNSTLTVGVIEVPPFAILDREYLHMECGSENGLLKTMSSYFNFSINFINYNKMIGQKLANGTWTGMMGSLINQEIDLGIGAISFDYDKSNDFSFFQPHCMSSVSFVTQTPRIVSTQFLHRPFDASVWYLFIVVLLVCFIFDRIQRRYNSTEIDLFWINFAQLFHQNSYQKLSFPSFISIWMISWNLGMFILSISYASCLYSLIAAPSFSATIDNIEQLFTAIQSGQIIATSLDNPRYIKYFEDWVGNTTFEIDNIWITVPYTTKAMDMIRDSYIDKSETKYAYIDLRETLQFAQADFDEKYIYLPSENFFSSMYTEILAIPVRKDFPYYNEFNRIQKLLFSSGSLNHWQQECYNQLRSKRKSHMTTLATKTNAFTLKQLNNFFMIYLQSILCSMIVFVIEFLWRFLYPIR
ncbi:glutamate receptor-like [Dermatophagoides pteronyssinus]|uniref:glutamate receptor-like n=1 Tax=Dermatophagoides pteronyssinus TaxID=6956 RepID=UPI003F668054